MRNIAVITDSDSSLPHDLAASFGIVQVPMTVHFDNETFSSGVDIDDRLLFEKVDRLKKLPTTSAPSPSAFQAAYEAAFQKGADAIICICVSSKISSSYSAALTACESFPSRDIRVVDSLNLSMGQGFMALDAVDAVRGGRNLDEITALLDENGKRLYLYAVLPTLKYLALSGRVGKFVAGMADTLNIKPILTVQEGKLVLLERIRTRSKAVERMLELVKEAVANQSVKRVAVIHINNPEGAREFQAQLCKVIGCPEKVITAEFGAGLSVHAGTGVVGVVIQTGRS